MIQVDSQMRVDFHLIQYLQSVRSSKAILLSLPGSQSLATELQLPAELFMLGSCTFFGQQLIFQMQQLIFEYFAISTVNLLPFLMVSSARSALGDQL